MWTSVLTPLRSLLIALGSLLLAYWYFSGDQWRYLAVVAAAMLVGLGLALDQLGRLLLKAKQPKAGVRLMEWWILAPSGIAAIASAVIIIIAVELAAPDDASSATKELLGALSAGITAFLTTMWIDPSEKADATIGDRVQSACFRSYSSMIGKDTNSRLAQVLNVQAFADPEQSPNISVGTVPDWKQKSRKLRAKVIDQEVRGSS
jgi:hypothetical protein